MQASSPKSVDLCRVGYLERAPYPSLLPLIGATRSIPEGTRKAVVLDFGHSFVERAQVRFHDDALVELRSLPDLSAFTSETTESTRELADRMVATITTTFQEAGVAGDMAWWLPA